MVYTALAYSIFAMRMDTYTTLTNNTDYSSHTKAIELI